MTAAALREPGRASADHRDAQIRHALTRLLHWASRSGVKAIAVEDLDFGAEKTREKHGLAQRQHPPPRRAGRPAPRTRPYSQRTPATLGTAQTQSRVIIFHGEDHSAYRGEFLEACRR